MPQAGGAARMSGFESIIYEVEDGRARITLNRPEKLNALTVKLMTELHEALWEADNDTSVHCVILRGAGRAFSAGYDLTGADSDYPPSRAHSEEKRYRGATSVDDDAWRLERSQRLRMALFDMHKPSIAQIQGYCLAGGTDVALLCDMLVAADDALIGFPPTRDLGSPPNHMWVYHVGPQWAKRLLLSGDMITGAEAQQIGLVMKAVPREHLEAEVEQLADRLAMIDPDLLSANKRVVNLALELMGTRTMQRLAAENDVRGHNSAAALGWAERVREGGLRGALQGRDGKFGDGRVRVSGPEARDANGRLVDE